MLRAVLPTVAADNKVSSELLVVVVHGGLWTVQTLLDYRQTRPQ